MSQFYNTRDKAGLRLNVKDSLKKFICLCTLKQSILGGEPVEQRNRKIGWARDREGKCTTWQEVLSESNKQQKPLPGHFLTACGFISSLTEY